MLKKRSRQIEIHELPCGFHGARIFEDNRWVKLSQIIPWDLVEKEYAKSFTRKQTGNPSITSRMAFGALVIKRELNLSDEETVTMIRENPHCQYFLGMDQFVSSPPFDSSKMVAFRKRFPAASLDRINEAIIQAGKDDPPETPDSGPSGPSDPESTNQNKGTLLMDATCAPANIRYPTDTGLLNKAREQSERLIDLLWEPGSGLRKPRTYRQEARKQYLTLARNKRPGRQQIRKTCRKQLGYLKRNLRIIEELMQDKALDGRDLEQLQVLQKIASQQTDMYEKQTNRVPDRIVSVHQPWVRPIVRGKQTARTEFGAKLATSMENGYSRIEKLSWQAFNEALIFQASCERYKDRTGVYPERVLADKIFRNRENLRYCQERGIRLNGPRLGRPPKDRTLYEEQKRLEREEAGERNAIEGKYGEAKTRYGLDRVMMERSDTSETDIYMVFVVMNLKKRLRDLFYRILKGLETHLFWTRVGLCSLEQ